MPSSTLYHYLHADGTLKESGWRLLGDEASPLPDPYEQPRRRLGQRGGAVGGLRSGDGHRSHPKRRSSHLVMR